MDAKKEADMGDPPLFPKEKTFLAYACEEGVSQA